MSIILYIVAGYILFGAYMTACYMHGITIKLRGHEVGCKLVVTSKKPIRHTIKMVMTWPKIYLECCKFLADQADEKENEAN